MIRFALLGLGVGALYALASQGLIVIYRGSGVLNFALGAIGVFGAYVEWELTNAQGWPFLLAAAVGIVVSALLGGLTYVLIMRPLRTRAPLVRVIATLGVLVTLQSLLILRYGSVPQYVSSALPTDVIHISGEIVITADRLLLLAIAGALTAGLYLLYRYTQFGISTTAVAENERAAGALGLAPDAVALGNWMLGCGIAGLAAILLAPIVTLQPSVMTNLILAATAAALVASFRSFPVALVAGLLVGVAQVEANRYIDQPGFGEAVPFIVIVAWLVLKGQALPLRDHVLQRLPSIGSGRIHPLGILAGTAVAVVALSILPTVWIDAFTVSFCVSFVLLSIVVLTGYAGQLSLAQFAIAGFGAWVAGRLAATQGLSFPVSLLIGVAATLPLGAAFALPAARTRGINLAVVTLGLGTAIELVLFANPEYTGGAAGTQVALPHIFGWNISAVSHPTRYGLVCAGLLALALILVANLRRGRSGRRLIAVRTNERAAASLGISVFGAKVYAFALSAAIAGLGGILLAFRSTSISYAEFTSFTSITDVGLAVIGGLGYLAGPLIGSTLAEGGVGSELLGLLGDGVAKYIPLISGVSLIVLVLVYQDGVAKEMIKQYRWVAAKLPGKRPPRRSREALDADEAAFSRVEPKPLEVRSLSVRYGGTVALDDVSFRVEPGQVVGLIGPNGAGKTTCIDAITGFVPAAGEIDLGGQEVSKLSVVRRARAGLGRSFQSLELFEDSTVIENLRAASDPRDLLSYARDLLWPVSAPLPAEVASAVRGFGLDGILDRQVTDLPYGQRRLLAIARAVATHPNVLLLDEPAAGLSSVESEELGELIRQLAERWGVGILLVEHDMDIVMSACDSIVVLDFGSKIAEGSPAAIREDEKVVAAYLGDERPAEARP